MDNKSYDYSVSHFYKILFTGTDKKSVNAERYETSICGIFSLLTMWFINSRRLDDLPEYFINFLNADRNNQPKELG